MTCVNCGYSTGYNLEKQKESNTEGDFYKLPVQMERRADYYPYKATTDIFACPKCCMVFIVKGKQ